MSLIQRVTALAQAVAADIKALYVGKAEKEHTHTAAQVSGLGTAATRDVLEDDFDKRSPTRLMYRGAFGLGAPAENHAGFYDKVSDLPKAAGFYKLKDGNPNSENGKPPLLGGYDSALIRTTRHATDYGADIWLPYHRDSPGMVIAPNNSAPVGHMGARLVSDSINMYQETGTSTIRTMSQKAISDAITNRGFADASGILTATSGALSNDMSSYLSSKTYAEMRTKLGVVPVNVVQDTGTSTTAVMSQKAVTEAIAAGGGSSGSVNVVQKDGLSASAVMSQYAVSEAIYELSEMSNISYLYDIEQHAAIHALDPETATLPQLIRALQSATLMDYEFEMPPPEP